MSNLETWKVECCAHAAHEANRAYCRTLGDESHLEWDVAPEWQKVSARAGVIAIFQNPTLTPEESHAGWMRQKLADGWRWGPTKDASTLEHPCIVSFADLPFEQQAKDKLFTAVVKATLAALWSHPQ